MCISAVSTNSGAPPTSCASGRRPNRSAVGTTSGAPSRCTCSKPSATTPGWRSCPGACQDTTVSQSADIIPGLTVKGSSVGAERPVGGGGATSRWGRWELGCVQTNACGKSKFKLARYLSVQELAYLQKNLELPNHYQKMPPELK